MKKIAFALVATMVAAFIPFAIAQKNERRDASTPDHPKAVAISGDEVAETNN